LSSITTAERKARNAARCSLGDGQFISDGETWRQRRRIVAPIVHVSHLPLFAPLMVQVALNRRVNLTTARSMR
jgi:cytochrome P450